MSICHLDKTLASTSQGVGVAQISDEVAGAKLGLLQFESWGSDRVAADGQGATGTEGWVALGDSWFAGLLPEPGVHITGHTGLTGPTGQSGG